MALFPVSPSKSGELPSSWRWKVTLWITNLAKTILVASHLIHAHFVQDCRLCCGFRSQKDRSTVWEVSRLILDPLSGPSIISSNNTQLHVENLDRVVDGDDSKLRHPLVKGHELVHIFEQHLLHVSPPSCQSSSGHLGSGSNSHHPSFELRQASDAV